MMNTKLVTSQLKEQNKEIDRGADAAKIFNNRSLVVDYKTLIPILKPGMRVLDIGCGTGAISKGIADLVGPEGKVIAIDNTLDTVEAGKVLFAGVENLELQHCDMFDFETQEQFDLVISARTVQWLSVPLEAILKMKSLLKPGGTLSVLDYNHEKISWQPKPPKSMQTFYQQFLKWRADAGMNNQIADHLKGLMEQAGLKSIQEIDASETYTKDRSDFTSKVGIWSKVADNPQMKKDKYLSQEQSELTVKTYDAWVENEAVSMTMYLKEVRGVV